MAMKTVAATRGRTPTSDGSCFANELRLNFGCVSFLDRQKLGVDRRLEAQMDPMSKTGAE